MVCIQAHSSKLLEDMDSKHMFSLKMCKKKLILGKNSNFQVVPLSMKSPCYVRTRDLRVGSRKLNSLRNRIRRNILAIQTASQCVEIAILGLTVNKSLFTGFQRSLKTRFTTGRECI